jgi:hypothetical protein
MKELIRKKIAMFMVLIVVMLPIYSALVIADLSIEARGSDNILNFVKEEDFITFKAVASISGDNQITPNQVTLGSSLEFDSCIVGINGHECKLRFPASGNDVFDARSIPYTITLKDDSGNAVDVKSDIIIVDNIPSSLLSFNVENDNVGTENVVFNFAVEDDACSDAGCEDKCSGIDKVELYTIGSSFNEVVNIDSESCSYSGNFEKSSSVFSEGENTIFATAYDQFGQASSTLSITVNVDTSPPFIDLNSLKIIDDTGFELDFFGTSPTPATVKVDITDTNLDDNSVYADLSNLGNLGTVKGNCNETNADTTTCYWPISLDPGSEGIKTITINASDDSGNDAQITTAKNLELDNEGPIVLSISTGNTFDGEMFAKLNGNTFTALLRDTEIGIRSEDIKLHTGSTVNAADSCELVIDTFQCTFDDISLTSGKQTAFIDTDSADRIGNSVQEKFSKEIIVDSSKPKLLKLVVKNIGGSSAAFENFTKTGDKLLVEAAIEDDALQSASADFSRFILNSGNVSADTCIKTSDDVFVCSWTTSSIDIEGFIDDFIRFEFTDIAGNKLSIMQSHIVFGVSGETAPDFFEHEVHCSPGLLDRETLSLIEQRAYCQVSLSPKSLVDSVGTFEDLTTLSIDLKECDGDVSPIESFELFNNDFGSTEPFIKANFKKQSMKDDKLEIVCPLDIITKKGNDITTVPETENVQISFQFYNLPQGEFSDSVQKKIDDAIDDVDNALKFVTWLKKAFFYAERGCQFINLAGQVVGFFMVAGDNLRIFSVSSGGTAEAQRLYHDFLTENFRENALGKYKKLNAFCGVINCKFDLEEKDKDGDATGDYIFGGAGKVLDTWNKKGESFLSVVTGSKIVETYTGKPYSSYTNPKDSIVISTLTGCIPGIIHNLDKMRQIQCMYADCLETGVGQQGLPVFACEDQKDYATCKYVVGEIFEVISFTAVFDYYIGLLKNTLRNPFRIIGLVPGYFCKPSIIPGEVWAYKTCAGAKIASFIGTTVNELTSIIDFEFFKTQDDYCDKFDDRDDDDDKDEDEDEESTSLSRR